jgi:hypothetical protein
MFTAMRLMEKQNQQNRQNNQQAPQQAYYAGQQNTAYPDQQGPTPYQAQQPNPSQYEKQSALPQQQPPQQQQQPPQQQQPGQPQQQVIYTNVPQGNVYLAATPIAALQSYPAVIDCPRCGARAMTIAEPESGNTTHAWAALFCFCFCLGCIPYLMSSLKDALHKCSSCGAAVALWHRSGRVEVLSPPAAQPAQQQS